MVPPNLERNFPFGRFCLPCAQTDLYPDLGSASDWLEFSFNQSEAPPTGFVHSLEFLKTSWNLQTSFPDLEKVWKIKIKSGKNAKKSGVFCFENCSKCLIAKWNFFQAVRSYLISSLTKTFNRRLKSLRTLLCQHCMAITGSSLFPKQFCSYRWVENVTVVERALEMWPHVKQYVTSVKKGKVVNPQNVFQCCCSKLWGCIIWSEGQHFSVHS